MGINIMIRRKKDLYRKLSKEEIALSLTLIRLILKAEKIGNIYQLYNKSLSCNWTKLCRLVLSQCLFETDEKGNIKKLHTEHLVPNYMVRNPIEECKYAKARCGNKIIIIHL